MIKLWRILPLAFTAVAVAFFSGCNRESDASKKTSLLPEGAAPDPGLPKAELVPDRSLPASEYISLGMPSCDRQWSAQDLTVAASKLRELAARAPEQLPRLGSERSGSLFARIVARDNLDAFRSRSLPLETRAAQAMEYLDSLNTVLKIYVAASVAKKMRGDELVELVGSELRVVQIQLELMSEFVPTLSKDDPTYPVRMEGLDEVRQGLATMLLGYSTMLKEVKNYDLGPRLKLLGYCRETFPTIVPELTASSRQEMRRHLDELANDASIRDLQPQITLLRDEVRAALNLGQ